MDFSCSKIIYAMQHVLLVTILTALVSIVSFDLMTVSPVIKMVIVLVVILIMTEESFLLKKDAYRGLASLTI